jgi:hypothetical protein
MVKYSHADGGSLISSRVISFWITCVTKKMGVNYHLNQFSLCNISTEQSTTLVNLVLGFSAPETYIFRLPYFKVTTSLFVVSFCVVRWMGTYPPSGDATLRSLLEQQATSSSSLALFFCNTQEIPTFWTLQRQPGRTHSASVNIYKRREEIPCMVDVLSHTDVYLTF